MIDHILSFLLDFHINYILENPNGKALINLIVSLVLVCPFD